MARLKSLLVCGAGLSMLMLATTANAQQRNFNIPSEPAVRSIPEFARQAGLQIIAPASQLAGVKTPAIKGQKDARAALRDLLVGTDLIIASDQDGVIALKRAPAPPAKSDVADDIQEVVVTASKRDERLHDVAMGVTAVTGNDLQTRQETDFTEFAAQVPGFQVESNGTPGFNREILRGQNSGSAGATVATVIDDMPLSSSGSQSDDGFVSTNPDAYDLLRVEVLKGPQGTLYGAAAEGGVVKFVTNPPNTTAFHAGMEVGGDTIDHGGDGGSVKGYVNIPFWQDKAALRLTGFYEDVPGYIP
jgi:outer membrane receptor protein involved in Fe transport